jgi:hypothetical protein
MLWRGMLEWDVEKLHRDFLDILARRFRAEVMLTMADAFLEAHLNDGLTLQNIASRLNTSVDEVRKMFDLNDSATKRGLGMLSDICAALDCQPVITIQKIEAPPQEQPQVDG